MRGSAYVVCVLGALGACRSAPHDGGIDALDVPSDAAGMAGDGVGADGVMLTDAASQGDGAPHFLVDPTPCGAAMPATGLPAGVIELADLGHQLPVVNAMASGADRVLSVDAGGYWILWDTATGRQVASGDRRCTATDPLVTHVCPGYNAWLAGPTVLDQAGTLVEVRSAADGRIRGTFATTTDTTLGLALDGSYVWGASSTALTIWSLTGAVLITHPGDYRPPAGGPNGSPIAGRATEVLVGGGPAGATVIEHIPLAAPSFVTRAFVGTFAGWFSDGLHFISLNRSAAGGVWRIYDPSAVMTGYVPLDTTGTGVQWVGGVGNYLWQATPGGTPFNVVGQLSIFTLDTLGTPLLTQPVPTGSLFASGAAILLPLSTADETFEVVRLDPAGVTVAMPSVPPAVDPHTIVTAFGAGDSGHWVVGDDHRRLYANVDLAPAVPARQLGCGAVVATRGSAGGTALVATEVGGVMLADLSAPAPRVRGVFPVTSSRVAVSADGTLLGVLEPRELVFTSLPAGSVAGVIPRYDAAGTLILEDFGLAPTGTLIVQQIHAFNQLITSLADVAQYREPQQTGQPLGLFASDGVHFASSLRTTGASVAAVTDVYAGDGTPLSAPPGILAGWLDDHRLVTYQASSANVCLGAMIYDTTGTPLAGPVTLPCTGPFDVVSPTHVYYGTGYYDSLNTWTSDTAPINHLFNVDTGAVVWSPVAPAPSQGAVAGTFVIEQSGNLLVAEPLPSPLP